MKASLGQISRLESKELGLVIYGSEEVVVVLKWLLFCPKELGGTYGSDKEYKRLIGKRSKIVEGQSRQTLKPSKHL